MYIVCLKETTVQPFTTFSLDKVQQIDEVNIVSRKKEIRMQKIRNKSQGHVDFFDQKTNKFHDEIINFNLVDMFFQAVLLELESWCHRCRRKAWLGVHRLIRDVAFQHRQVGMLVGQRQQGRRRCVVSANNDLRQVLHQLQQLRGVVRVELLH